jgi:sugar/nucleoside kinase (ribokinase family)
VRFAARVGAADFGTFVTQWSKMNVEAAFVPDPELPSGMLVTLVAPDGERSFFTDRGANAALAAEDLPATLLDDCQMLVISGYSLFEAGPRAAVMGLMAAAIARRVPIAIDPASVGFLEEVGPANFVAWTAGASTIFANESEALALTGEHGTEAQMRALTAAYPRAVIKRGARGAIVGDRGGMRLSRPAPLVQVIDSTGAGDAFAATFIAAELGGASLEAALEQAIAAGAAAVTRIGGRPPTD